MKIHNLGKPDGEFETRSVGNSRRQFGFPTTQEPSIGDLVIIQRETGKVLYQIESIEAKTISRYEDLPEYLFYRGVMRDVIATNSLTPRMIMLIKHKGLA